MPEPTTNTLYTDREKAYMVELFNSRFGTTHETWDAMFSRTVAQTWRTFIDELTLRELTRLNINLGDLHQAIIRNGR